MIELKLIERVKGSGPGTYYEVLANINQDTVSL
jgi:hypothetical protein